MKLTERHPLATSLALLILAGKHRGIDDLEESAQDSIAGLLQDYSDEHKADIYARIVEGVDPNPTYMALETAVNRALLRSEQDYGRP